MSTAVSTSEKPPLMTKFRWGKVYFRSNTQLHFSGGMLRFCFGFRPYK